AGGFIQALEFAAEVDAKIIGKPSKDFFHLAVTSMGLEPEDILMVGDDIISDIQGAQQAGLKTALVQTGKFQSSDLQRGITPDAVLKDMTELVALLA
ncbi:HAD-IA family hydrolase, partial [Sulfurovum sp.]|uniref:HAD-IA family hydrolase n=1 Tax=Sulfurovum sp. TaxID=1969726 RepID=UPI0025DA0AC6